MTPKKDWTFLRVKGYKDVLILPSSGLGPIFQMWKHVFTVCMHHNMHMEVKEHLPGIDSLLSLFRF